MLGPGIDRLEEVKILNRLVGWHGSEGIKYEAGARHIEIIFELFGLLGAKAVSVPGTGREGRTQSGHEGKLGSNDVSRYMAIVARCKYFAPERADMAYAVKGLARHIANPTCGNWPRLKRLERYLKGCPCLPLIYPWQHALSVLKVYGDVGWAGCKKK